MFCYGVLMEVLFDNYNTVRFDEKLGDFFPKVKFQKLVLRLMQELASLLLEQKKPEVKVQQYVESFLSYFESEIPYQIPEIQDSGLVIAQLLEKMIFEVIGTENNFDFDNFKKELRSLANKDSKDLSNLVRTYQNCFELILQIFSEEEPDVAEIKSSVFRSLKQCLDGCHEQHPKLKASKVVALMRGVEDLFSQFKTHGIQMDISGEERYS